MMADAIKESVLSAADAPRLATSYTWRLSQPEAAIKPFAKRIEAQGKLFKVAITACRRKLLVILNTLVKTNSTWAPDHAQQLHNN